MSERWLKCNSPSTTCDASGKTISSKKIYAARLFSWTVNGKTLKLEGQFLFEKFSYIGVEQTKPLYIGKLLVVLASRHLYHNIRYYIQYFFSFIKNISLFLYLISIQIFPKMLDSLKPRESLCMYLEESLVKFIKHTILSRNCLC